ncbi:TonB family protein [Polyangium sp. 6x1]|uniref:energy transducer TonB n=1 Tax=Polyangium sp. 6x1 TaxID=3042689 RepID=UPI0024824D4F|nr:TonB family protein [Polyangium sp. 6x1]MDI1442627.1 TonB family protein [Polyangium sp. 6x1]
MNRWIAAAWFVASVAACAPKEGAAPSETPKAAPPVPATSTSKPSAPVASPDPVRRERCLTDPLPPGVVPYTEGMKRPEPAVAPPIEGESDMFSLTPEDIARPSQGNRIRARCIVTTQGQATDCILLETLPYMSEAALSALAHQPFKPAESNGAPIAVEYEFAWAKRIPPELVQTPPWARNPPFDYAIDPPPRKISGPEIRLSPQALCNQVEGMMVVRCTITEEGAAEGCRVFKTLPYMEQEVVRALEASRFEPVERNGRRQRVTRTFPFHFTLPER